MDNRLRFLYYFITELWGRRERVRSGNGKTGTSGIADMQEKPYVNAKT